jgi:hypothetical protein
MVVRRSGPYRGDGFPVALDLPGVADRRRRHSPVPLVLAGVGGTGVLAIAVLTALVLSGNYSTGALPSWTGLSKPVTSAVTHAGVASAASPSPRHNGSSSSPTATPGSKPSASGPTPAAPAKPTPSRASSGSASPAATATSASAASINVSPGSLLLQSSGHGGYGGQLTLINPTSSDMNWSISLPQGLAVWGPTSGTLQPNSDNTKLWIYATGGHGGGQGSGQGQGQGQTTETITLEPGNVQVTVTIP